MDRVWDDLKRALKGLIDETEVQERLGILDCMSKEDEPDITKVLSHIDKPSYRDVELAQNALRLVCRYAAKLVEHRELHAFRDVIIPQFKEFTKERGMSEEEVSRLTDELLLITNATVLKKWWAKLKGAEARRAQEEAHRAFLASIKRREAVATDSAPTTREECDLRLRSLRERASRVESTEGRRLYEQGLQDGLTRHDQIRLFGAALHIDAPEGDIVVLEEKRVVVETKTANEVKHTNLSTVIEERFAGLLNFVGDSDHQQMALEIIRVLARFGRREMFVGESYLPLNMLRKLVRRDYRLRLARPFDPSLFFVVVAILVKVKVLIKYNGKAKDSMMSISSHVNDATTPLAGRVIATILALKRETSNGG